MQYVTANETVVPVLPPETIKNKWMRLFAWSTAVLFSIDVLYFRRPSHPVKQWSLISIFGGTMSDLKHVQFFVILYIMKNTGCNVINHCFSAFREHGIYLYVDKRFWVRYSLTCTFLFSSWGSSFSHPTFHSHCWYLHHQFLLSIVSVHSVF